MVFDLQGYSFSGTVITTDGLEIVLYHKTPCRDPVFETQIGTFYSRYIDSNGCFCVLVLAFGGVTLPAER